MAHGVPGFSSILLFFSADTEPGRKELMAHSVPGFPLCNYFYANMEPGGEELVAHGVPGFSSV